MAPKRTVSCKREGDHDDEASVSTPMFKTRVVPKSRCLVPASGASPGTSGSAGTAPPTNREGVDEWRAPNVLILAHDYTAHLITVLVAHFVMQLAGRKLDGVTGCKYAKWQDATDAIVGAVLMGLLENLGCVPTDLTYGEIEAKIHKCGHNTVSKKTRSRNEAAPSSVKQENEDKYSQWDASWGKFFKAQRRPSSWEKLIDMAHKFKEGILPDPQYFLVRSLFVTDAMAKHMDEGFKQLVADKAITLKPAQLRDAIDADLQANRAAIVGLVQTFNNALDEAQNAHDFAEHQRQQDEAAAAEAARIAAEAAAAAASAAQTPAAKLAKIDAAMAKAKADYEAQIQALQEAAANVGGDVSGQAGEQPGGSHTV